MDNQIKVTITGDAKGLEASVNKAEKSVSKFDKSASKNLQGFAKSTESASKGAKQLDKTSGNASNTLTEFSRVIQDAPFGIRGVGNNITQLAGNFGSLTRASGGVLPALKALGSSFLGPGGIIFAISTAVSLLTVYGDKLLGSVSSTAALGKATAKFVGEANAEIASLETLISIAQDKSKSDNVRLQAIEELNKNYGDYLGNLTLEEIGTDRVNNAVQRLTRSLIKQAQVKGLNARIEEITADNSEDLINKQLELSQAYKALEAEIKSLIGTNAVFRDRIKEGLSLDETLSEITRVSKATGQIPVGVVAAVGKVNELNKEVKVLKKETEDALKPVTALLNSVQTDKFLLDSQAELKIEGVELTPKAQAERDAGLATRAKITGIDQSGLESGGIKPIEVPITASSEGVENLVNGLDTFDSKLKGSLITANVFSEGVSGAISGMSSNITTALETGNEIVDGFFNGIINSLSNYLTQLATAAITDIAIKQAQSTASGVAAATSTAAAAGPAGAFLLPGLIAGAVAAVAGAFSSINFAQGGIVPGGSFSGDKIPAMVNSGEMILNSRQQSNLFSMLNGNLGKIGAAETPTVQVEGSLRGSNIRLANLRAGRKNKRYSA